MTVNQLDAFEVFPWNKNLETGITLIDTQHKKLVALLNRLAAHLADRSSEIEITEIFNELVAYTDYHFKTEESIWQPNFLDDPWFTEHHHTHNAFIEKVSEFKNQDTPLPLDEVVADVLGFLTHWLAYHILDSDKRMAKVVLALQSGLPLEQAKQQSELEMSGSMKVLIDTVLSMYDSLSSRTMELLREKSEHKRAEEALQASEERWRFVLEGAGDGLWDWNITSGDIYRSSNPIGLFELVEAGTSNSIHPEDLPRVKEDLQAHLDGTTETFINEHRVLHETGRWSWMLTRGKVTSRDGQGKPLRMIGTHSDITDRILASSIFNNTSEGMVIADANNNIITLNPAFTRITGYSPEETIGKKTNMLRSGRHDADFYHAMWNQINTTGQWAGEIWNRRKNGEVYPELLAINTISNPDGSPSYRIGIFSDITNQKQSQELLWKQSNYDLLTGLPNRMMLRERARDYLKKSQRLNSLMALAVIDIDRFKDVNNALGHTFGDVLLKEIARRLENSVREADTVARLSADEFAVILYDLNDPGMVERIVQTILDKLSQVFHIENEAIHITASIGITVYPDDDGDADVLLKNAEQAMHAAKDKGRNRFSYFTRSMQEASQVRIRFTSLLRHALEYQQLEIHYQPIVDLATGAIRKAEALIRWQHPELGTISPGTFIPIAEEIGMIVDIGNWVFEEAARKTAHWRAAYSADFQISINKSPVQFVNDTETSGQIAWFEHLLKLGLPGSSIAVEITEGLMMDSNQAITDQLALLRSQGFKISLDDFGTGYSSLSYLHKFDIDYVKIDQSFIRNLDQGSKHIALCEAIIVMAHKLGLKVVAEGIETEFQRDMLINAGCDYGQGYLFSHPIPADAFEQLMATAPSRSA